jgi:hypothetical protein
MTDWVEITALVAGPVLAVGLSLWRERKRQRQERKLSVVRQLMLSRSNVGEAGFSAAINLVPIEYGHDEPVMTAWESFTHAADRNVATSQLINELLEAMMIALGYGKRSGPGCPGTICLRRARLSAKAHGGGIAKSAKPVRIQQTQRSSCIGNGRIRYQNAPSGAAGLGRVNGQLMTSRPLP